MLKIEEKYPLALDFINKQDSLRVKVLSFENAIEYGKTIATSFTDSGYPMSFTYRDLAFTHETDEIYIVGKNNAPVPGVFSKLDCIVFYLEPEYSFIDRWDVFLLGYKPSKPDVPRQKPELGQRAADKIRMTPTGHQGADEIKQQSADLIAKILAYEHLDPDLVKRAIDGIEVACILAVKAATTPEKKIVTVQ